MRFEGTRSIDMPATDIWHALRNPLILEHIIPNCTRIERQPGHTIEGERDFAMGFEIGTTDVATGAEPIIGWIEVDRQSASRHMGVSLTLNDALTFLRAEGMITLHSREREHRTDLHYSFEVRFPGLQGVGWSSEAHASAETTIAGILDALPRAIKLLANASQSAGHKIEQRVAGKPRILAQSERGKVVLMPAIEVPAPTQSMLRRLAASKERRLRRRARTITLWSLAGIALVAVLTSGASILWHKSQARSNAES
jgi:hypothetical protein